MTDSPTFALKPRRRMLQPTKDELRRRLAVAQARVASLETLVASLEAQRPVRAFLFRLWARLTPPPHSAQED